MWYIVLRLQHDAMSSLIVPFNFEGICTFVMTNCVRTSLTFELSTQGQGPYASQLKVEQDIKEIQKRVNEKFSLH